MVHKKSSDDMLLTYGFLMGKKVHRGTAAILAAKIRFPRKPEKSSVSEKTRKKSSVSEKSRETVRNMMSEIRISYYDLVSYELGVPGVRLEENEGEDDRSQMAGCCTEDILN